MTQYNILCDGPGPHDPGNGILGTSDQPNQRGNRCNSPACVYVPPPEVVNEKTIRTRVEKAYTDNMAFLAIPNPTNAQIAAQVRKLTQQNNALIKMHLGLLDDVTGT